MRFTPTCWLWTGPTFLGYGRLSDKAGGRRSPIGTHRVSWELAHGPIPQGLNVLHHCDTPACVRPAHLFLGTHADNVADRHAKGRDAKGDHNGKRTRPERIQRGDAHWQHTNPELAARGERVGGAKLTADQVREIRTRYVSGATLMALAADYGVRFTNIHMIVKRRTWAHIA